MGGRMKIRPLPAAILAAAVVLTAGATHPGSPDLPAPFVEADFPHADPAEVRLGRLLFWDPVLSGNRNISCGTCHHPRFATGDGLSLGLGEGGSGLGPERVADAANLPEQFIPRNAPPLFNAGARQMTVMFADGRIEVDPHRPSGLRTPMEDEMLAGFDSLLSAQTMFPVLSPDEMAGHYHENDVSMAVRRGTITGEGGAWDLIARRVALIPAYRQAFEAVYPEIGAGRGIAFTDVSNAIAAFVSFEWRSDESPFDAALRGESPLAGKAAEGAVLFYGEAGCGTCHSGPLLSDMAFHAMGEPQLGPGKAERFERHSRDEGRGRVTGRAEDAYAFRTPPLRNVARTGPWGHAGAHPDLREFVAYHADPAAGLPGYARDAVLPKIEMAKPVWAALDDPDETARIAAAATTGPALTEGELDALMAFLDALTDEAALSGRLGIPDSVPSGLPVDR